MFYTTSTAPVDVTCLAPPRMPSPPLPPLPELPALVVTSVTAVGKERVNMGTNQAFTPPVLPMPSFLLQSFYGESLRPEVP